MPDKKPEWIGPDGQHELLLERVLSTSLHKNQPLPRHSKHDQHSYGEIPQLIFFICQVLPPCILITVEVLVFLVLPVTVWCRLKPGHTRDLLVGYGRYVRGLFLSPV